MGWGGWTDAHVLDLNRDGQLAQGAMTGDNLGEFGHPLFTTAELRANCGSFSGKNIKRAFIYGSASSALGHFNEGQCPATTPSFSPLPQTTVDPRPHQGHLAAPSPNADLNGQLQPQGPWLRFIVPICIPTQKASVHQSSIRLYEREAYPNKSASSSPEDNY